MHTAASTLASFKAGRGQVALDVRGVDPGTGRPLARQRQGHRREVDAEHDRAGPPRDLLSDAATTACQVEQRRTRRQQQRVDDLGDAAPGNRVVGPDVWRQAEVTLHEFVLCRSTCHVGVPPVEVGRIAITRPLHDGDPRPTVWVLVPTPGWLRPA